MPALNIRFTDEEIAILRARAHQKGVSMQKLAHDTVINCAMRATDDQLIAESAARVIALSRDLLDRLADQ